MKSAIFIDASCVRPALITAKTRQQSRIEWKSFIKWIKTFEDTDVCDVHFFDSMPISPDSAIAKFHTFLAIELQFRLHLLPTKSRFKNCPSCHRDLQPDDAKIDVSLAIHMLKLAPFYEQAIFVSDSSDCNEVLQILRDEQLKKITVVCWADAVLDVTKQIANRIYNFDEHFSTLFTADSK